jgi:hypothetical protein
MNLSKLLASRESILARARLANVAFAYVTLNQLAAVVRRGQISGFVRLQQLDEKEERYWATLTALSGSQSVLDEHFSDDDVAAMADAVAIASPGVGLDVTFRLEDLESEYIGPLELALERAGVSLDTPGVRMQRRSK